MAPFYRFSEDKGKEAIGVLSDLIAIPSISREEKQTADYLENYFKESHIPVKRKENNVWVANRYFDAAKPTYLLNSHHDTVKPNAGYTNDPFTAIVENDKLYGLGSNDAGGPLVSLLITFLHFYEQSDLSFNLIFAATAEEEISGREGVESILDDLGNISGGIIGEPTGMEMAVSEKGLMVLDCIAKGRSGHAARNEGENAIYKALKDIGWFKTFSFPKESKHLGPIKMSVTMIESGSQHNVVPDTCKFVVDVRTTDAYTNEATLAIIKEHVESEVTPRSTRLQPSRIDGNHPLVIAATESGINLYGSPTMSDQALMPFPTVKMGPGKSERSHTANEFIFVHEIESGIDGYIRLLTKLNQVL